MNSGNQKAVDMYLCTLYHQVSSKNAYKGSSHIKDIEPTFSNFFSSDSQKKDDEMLLEQDDTQLSPTIKQKETR